MSSQFITPDFLLDTPTARYLYHNHSASMPIIDYHCHLNAEWIAKDMSFDDLYHIWLGGDHYKWRAMRACGVDEEFITGGASVRQKFAKWAEVVPRLMRNPLYHWTHLELLRVFDINHLLSKKTEQYVWDACNELLKTPQFSTREIIKKFGVEAICTTDDPTDSLEYHNIIAHSDFGVSVLPTWRADKVMEIGSPFFMDYIHKLEQASSLSISRFDDLIGALRVCQEKFAAAGCRLSDHGLDQFYAEKYTVSQIDMILDRAFTGKSIDDNQQAKFKSAMLYELAVMDYEKDWTQQFHIGPIRNNHPLMHQKMGADIGYDAINDKSIAVAGHKFFGRLASEGKLTRTILYNLNPKDTEVMAVMAATFNQAPSLSKMQYGAAWWFLDNEDGITRQLEACSNFGVLSNFVGMLTDSRSVLSYPRHEYFRRILCNIIGHDVDNGRLPNSEIALIGAMIEDISYYNAKKFLAL